MELIREAQARLAGVVLLIFVVAQAVFLVLPANTDLMMIPGALHMDERIYFYQIFSIFNSASPDELARNIVGTDFRYGRLTYWLPTLLSLPAYPWFGDGSIILASRFTSYASILLIAFICYFFGGRYWTSALGAIVILCLPFSDYYATVPKPDALQTLMTIVAIHLIFVSRWKSAFFLVGVVIGLKISGLILLPILIWLILQLTGRHSRLGELDLYRFFYQVLLCLGCLIGGFAFCTPIIFLGTQGWDVFLLSTLSQVSHGSDLDGPPIGLWMANMGSLLGGKFELTLIASMTLLALISVFNQVVHLPFLAPLKGNGKSSYRIFGEGVINLFCRQQSPGTVFCVLGFIWFFAIVLSVPRLWGFYLWPALVFSVYGLTLNVGAALSSEVRAGQIPRLKVAAFAILTASVFALFIGTFLVRGTSHYNDFMSRTSVPDHAVKSAQLAAATKFIETLKAAETPPLIHFDPRLYQPSMGVQATVVNYWGAYKQWDQDPDAIIVLEDTFEKIVNPVTALEKDRQKFLPKSLTMLAPPHGTCISDCYELRQTVGWDDHPLMQIWVKHSKLNGHKHS